jgi:hypothetical protein
MALFRFDGEVRNAVGEAIAGASIYICNQPANTSSIPPSPLASTFADLAGTQPANPVTSDGNGNFFFYAAPGTYTVVYFDPFNRIPTTVFADQSVISPGAGTVTSVGMTGDGVIQNSVVPGSPIVASGTLAPTLVPFAQKTVLAGPTSGAAAPPSARLLASTDLPAGTGTVTSVAATLTPTAPLTASVGGSPIVGAGTLALTVGIANEPANKFLAGPTSGGSGAVSARSIVPADLPGLNAVAFSATPTFDASISDSFSMTLTGNVTSSTISNATAGQTITFILKQDGTGNRRFAWAPNVKGPSPISPDANSFSVQAFIYDGTNWRATDAGMTMGS